MLNEIARRQGLISKLQELRPILAYSGHAMLLEVFDDLLDHHEFGLALNLVCDYLLSKETPVPDALTVDRIRALHSAMNVEDECVVLLLAKTGQPAPKA